MKSTWFRTREQFEFAKAIQRADEGRHIHECFSGFLEASFCSVAQGAHAFTHNREKDPLLEEEYEATIARFDNPGAFPAAFSIMVGVLDKQPQDFLGDCYQCLALADKEFKGQCFTPLSLCRLIIKMSLGDVHPVEGQRLTVSEPCVGAGAIVIALSEHLKDCGFSPWEWVVYATDVSLSCFYMAYVQLSLLGVPGYITLGNSLMPRTDDRTVATLAAAMYPHAWEKPAATHHCNFCSGDWIAKGTPLHCPRCFSTDIKPHPQLNLRLIDRRKL